MKSKHLLAITYCFFILVSTHAKETTSIEMICPPSIEELCGSNSILPSIITYEDFINLGGTINSECRIIEESFITIFIDSFYIEEIGRMEYLQDFSIEDSCGNTGYCSFYYSKPVEFIIPDDIYASDYCGSNDDILAFSGLPLSTEPSIISIEEFAQAGGKINESCDQFFYDNVEITYYDSFLQDENLYCKTQLIRTFHFFHPFYDFNKIMEQYIGIFDYEDPVLVQAPIDTTVYGYYDAAVIFNSYQEFVDAGGVVADNCNIDESAFNITGSDTHGYCPFVITKYYGVYDECGNRVSVEHTTYAYDTIPPEIKSDLDNVNISCMKNLPPLISNVVEFEAAGGWAYDISEIQSISFIKETIEGVNPNVITRTYEVADKCGNSTTCEQTIFVYDAVPPVTSCPSSEIDCIDDLPPVFFELYDLTMAGGTVTDNCSVDTTYLQLVNETMVGSCPKLVTRTYQVSDFSGNTSTFDHVINIVDTIPPVFTGIPNLTFECFDDVPAPFDYYEYLAAGGEITDNCAVNYKINIFVSESMEGTCPAIIKRIYEVEDSCGNVGAWEHTITVHDKTRPTLIAPPDLFLECKTELPPAFSNINEFIQSGGEVSDNCELDSLSFILTDAYPLGDHCSYQFVRIYQIKDKCGNNEYCVHSMYKEDYAKPYFLTSPKPINDIFQGDPLPIQEDLFYDDNCGVASYTKKILPYNVDSINGYSITYVWNIADSCGYNTSAQVSFNVLPQPPIEYCEPVINASSEWIAVVSIDGLSNISSTGGGYENFSDDFTFNLTASSIHTINLTPDFVSKATFEYWAVWIDYNIDGDFTEDEKVFSANKKRSVVSGELTIPNVGNIETRLRVVMSRDGSPVSCPETGNGEVEDYLVIITGAVPQPPVANFSSDKTTVTVGSSIQFFDESTNNPSTRLWTFSGGDPASSNTANPTVSYNTVGTFDVTLTVSNDIGEDTHTSQITVADDQPVLEYCKSKSLSSSKEWIASVSIGSINNSSGAATYSDFTSQSTSLTIGETVTIDLTPGFSKNSQREYWKVWIDFDQNSIFEDEELVFSSGNARSSVSGNIVVTPEAMLGATRMRVSMKATAFSTPCEIFDRGEVEDYTVVISNTKNALTDIDELEKHETWMVYPNPVTTVLNIKYKSKEASTISIFNSQGALLKQQQILSDFEQVDVVGFAPGAYYLVIQSGEVTLRKKFIKQ